MALNNDNQNVYIAIIDRTCLSERKSAAVNTFQLSCFVEVAATLNFSQAAKNLGVSQPAVSHQIKALEDELGATLVSRSTRTVSLTDEGLQFLSYANDILYLAVRGSRLVSRSHASATRTLSIGVHGGIEAIALAPVLRGLIEAEPDVTPDVRVAPHSALLNMLESGTLDVVLEYRDPAGAPASATVFKRIAESPAALICTHDHPFAQRDKIDADEIKRAGRIAICSPHASLAAIDTLQRKVLGHVSPEDVIMCSGVEPTVALTAAGVAVAVLPNIPDMTGQGIYAIPVEGIPGVVFGVRVRRGRLSPVLNAFIRVLSAEAARSARAARGVSAPSL